MGRKRFDYALALIGQLQEHCREFADIRKIAKTSGLPKAYLEKVAQELKHAGWLESRRGPQGGYRLMRNKKSVPVEELMRFYSPVREFCPVLRNRKLATSY